MTLKITRMMDIGLIQKYFKDEMEKVAVIKDAKKTEKLAKPLSLVHLEGPFIIYSILNGISIGKSIFWFKISLLESACFNVSLS